MKQVRKILHLNRAPQYVLSGFGTKRTPSSSVDLMEASAGLAHEITLGKLAGG
jgi:hypothetical protein